MVSRRGFMLGGAGAAAGLALGALARQEKQVTNTGAGSGGNVMPTAFIPHGGGPWHVLALPGMPEDERAALAAYMRSVAQVPARKPSALLVVSAHWEEPVPTVNTMPAPGMYYDYGGFPPEAYELQWPAPGDPALASEVTELLRAAGFRTAHNASRGYDHGTFVPLMLAYPQADVPVVQLSLKRGLDPAEHLAMGQALAPLRKRGVYILGSGNSYHNLRAFFGGAARSRAESEMFDRWLNEAVARSGGDRQAALLKWEEAPAARACHPREEHLIPLYVAAGAAMDDAGRVGWTGTMGGMRLSAHYFG